MKRINNYETPELDVIVITTEDVITTSLDPETPVVDIVPSAPNTDSDNGTGGESN